MTKNSSSVTDFILVIHTLTPRDRVIRNKHKQLYVHQDYINVKIDFFLENSNTVVHQVVLLPLMSGVWFTLELCVLSLWNFACRMWSCYFRMSSRCVHFMTGSLMRLLWLLCRSWWHEVVRHVKSPLWGTPRVSRASWWAQRASWQTCSALVTLRAEASSWVHVWWGSAATRSSTSARKRERGCCVQHPKSTSPSSHPTRTANLAGERDEGGGCKGKCNDAMMHQVFKNAHEW